MRLEAYLLNEGRTKAISFDEFMRLFEKNCTQAYENQFKKDVKTYNPINLVNDIAPREILIITGDRDELIDIDGIKQLYDQAKHPKMLKIVKGADHKLSSLKTYRLTNQIIIEWFKTNLKIALNGLPNGRR